MFFPAPGIPEHHRIRSIGSCVVQALSAHRRIRSCFRSQVPMPSRRLDRTFCCRFWGSSGDSIIIFEPYHLHELCQLFPLVLDYTFQIPGHVSRQVQVICHHLYPSIRYHPPSVSLIRCPSSPFSFVIGANFDSIFLRSSWISLSFPEFSKMHHMSADLEGYSFPPPHTFIVT